MKDKLTDEYRAAVNLGYISEARAEKELRAAKIISEVDREDVWQKKTFYAGYLWMNFQMSWDVTENDLKHAEDAWHKYCDHMDKIRDHQRSKV